MRLRVDFVQDELYGKMRRLRKESEKRDLVDVGGGAGGKQGDISCLCRLCEDIKGCSGTMTQVSGNY